MPLKLAASEQSQRPSSDSEGSGEPDSHSQSDYDTTEIKSSLEQILNEVKTSGSFAIFGTTQNTPLCSLSVHEVGPIGLPLTARDAQAIKAVCHRSPFGKGSDTVVDESVRKTWELNPDQFNLSNPNWTKHVSELASKAMMGLGCPAGMMAKASLYKLLLYEKGAMFKAHKDTEKERGMFGTLVICLPSVHTGGEVIVSHHGERKVLQTAIGSDFNTTYADVRHSIEPITSGNCLVLVYNLLQVSRGDLPSSSLLLEEKRRLGRILAGWNRGMTSRPAALPKFLLFQFEHEYTDDHLKFDSLKGLDKVKADYLRETCHRNNIGLYLSSMKRSIEGECEEDDGDHVIEEVLEEKIELQRMINLDGNVIAQEIAVDESDIGAEDPFDRVYDHEDYEEYTGNAGPSATQYFNDTVAVLAPFVSRNDWLFPSCRNGLVDTNTWMDCLLETTDMDNATKADIQHLALLMRDLHQEKEKKPSRWSLQRACFSKPKAGRILKASIELSSSELFADGLRLLDMEGEIPRKDFMTVGKGISLFQVPFNNAYVLGLIAHKRTFGDRAVALHSLTGPHYPQDGRPELIDSLMKSVQLSEWRHSKLVEVTRLTKTLDQRDGHFLAACLSGLYADRYKDFAERNRYNAEFAAGLMARTLELGKSGRANDRHVESIIERFLGSFIHSFSFKAPDLPTTETLNTPSKLVCPSSAHDVAFILGSLYTTDKQNHIDAVESINRALTKPPTAILDGFAMELLQRLSTSIQRDRSLATVYAGLFRTTLVTYVEQYVQRRPPPGDWARPAVGDGCCRACRRLDNFLGDPAREVGKFDLDSATRAHLHQLLNGTNHKHVTMYGDVLTVTKGKDSQRAKHNEWAKRPSIAQKKMAELDRGLLIEMLGKDDVEQLLACKVVRRATQSVELQVTGTKRKRAEPEVIDLT